eukprot:COSAG02_NODE_31752_length_528_cov_0.692308_1_plen_154_part_00
MKPGGRRGVCPRCDSGTNSTGKREHVSVHIHENKCNFVRARRFPPSASLRCVLTNTGFRLLGLFAFEFAIGPPPKVGHASASPTRSRGSATLPLAPHDVLSCVKTVISGHYFVTEVECNRDPDISAIATGQKAFCHRAKGLLPGGTHKPNRAH